MKRLFDINVSLIGLLVLSPVLLPVMFLVWRQDGHSPFYIAPRVGKGERIFRMVKLRSMVINADKSGVDSTSGNDSRITSVGHFIRRYKLDELTELWNVLLGDMSLVGPRPNVQRETNLYSEVEKELLSVRPGITDFSSIVFSLALSFAFSSAFSCAFAFAFAFLQLHVLLVCCLSCLL